MDVTFIYRTLKEMLAFKPLLFRRTSTHRFTAWKFITQRTYQTSCEALIYRKHGPYSEVLKLENIPIPHIGHNEIHIRMLAAPVNPADVNMLQGNYGILPNLPAVGGNEGVGEVIKVGCQVHHLKPGQWVVPIDCGFGTWRTEAVCKANEVIPVAKDISVISAATLSVNPCTAYRMLTDFVTLRPGDTVIQNGANSCVGQAVIQICASMGVNTINVIRDRSNLSEMIKKLQSLGANYVITEDMLQNEGMANLFKVVERPKLALNCVGGSSAGNLFSHLKDGSTMVTYGGMSRKPTPLPAKAMIFKNIKLCGFWMTQWKRNHLHVLVTLLDFMLLHGAIRGHCKHPPGFYRFIIIDQTKLMTMVSDLTMMIRRGQLLDPSYTEVPFCDFSKALQATMDPYTNKHVLIMN